MSVNQLFRFLSVRSTRLMFSIAIIVVATGGLFSAKIASASDETHELQVAVQKMNFWMNQSSQAEGWRRFLLLYQLEAQTALGNQANIDTLKTILAQFSSDESGLQHPVFQNTKEAIQRQIDRLVASRTKPIASLLFDSKSGFDRVDAGDIGLLKNEVIENLESLRRYYRSTMPSRKRANLFYDLQLNPMISFLNDLKFEPAPEVSAEKIESIIRDLRRETQDLVEKIDALPIETPGPMEDGEDETAAEDGLDLSLSNQELSDRIFIGDGPSEDKDEETREELLKQKKQLDEKQRMLLKQRRDILKADRPRRQRRAVIGRQLNEFEDNLTEFQKQYGDPYFDQALNSLKKLSLRYSFGTSGNLQESMLNRIAAIESQLEKIDADGNDRDASGKLGDALRWLESSGQAQPLVTALRTKYSTPNAYFSVSSNLLNRVGSQSLSDRQPIRQHVFGRLIRGCSQTDGNVTFQFLNDPNQIHARIQLDASVQSSTYLQQGKIQVFTGSNGSVQAYRDIFANVGGLFWNEPVTAANFQSSLTGTNSSLRLVNKVVDKQFNKSKAKADAFTAKQARDQAGDQFDEQTLEPLTEARGTLKTAIQEALNKSNWLPAFYLRTTNERLHAVVKKETSATLAAPASPQEFGIGPEVAIRVHETLLSNYLDDIFKGKTFTNEQLAEEFADLTGELPPGLTGENAEGDAAEDFSITFARVRPIQFEFTKQRIRVVVAGQKFAQGDQNIDAGLKIILQFKVVEEDEELKIKRDGKVLFEFIDPRRTTPKLVAFRRFLDERLNDQMENEETETILPDNLLPIDEVPELADSPIARKMRLVQFHIDGGWVYLGWNHEDNAQTPLNWVYDLSAIQRE